MPETPDLTERPQCDGSVFCRIPGHVQITKQTRNGTTYSHVHLTAAQRRDLEARRG